MKNEIQSVVEKLGCAFDPGAGPIPLERVVALHLGAFQDLRARGLTWEQISRLLVRAGVVRPDGRPFGAAHLRGIYARQLKRQERLMRSARSARDHPRGLGRGSSGTKTGAQLPRPSNVSSRSAEVAGNGRERAAAQHVNVGEWQQDCPERDLPAGRSDDQETRPSASAAGGDVALRDTLRRAAAARKTQR